MIWFAFFTVAAVLAVIAFVWWLLREIEIADRSEDR